MEPALVPTSTLFWPFHIGDSDTFICTISHLNISPTSPIVPLWMSEAYVKDAGLYLPVVGVN